jgi:ribosomal protein S18 acetylase RimI-like enzyme
LKKYVNVGEIAAFINGTCSAHKAIHHESMSTHDPHGRYLVIHSVTVSDRYRRQALASNMLRDYVNYLTTNRKEIVGVSIVKGMCSSA